MRKWMTTYREIVWIYEKTMCLSNDRKHVFESVYLVKMQDKAEFCVPF